MLVLSRRKGEKIVIRVTPELIEKLLASGDPKIVITMIEITPSKCRMGFEALKEVPIHREEVDLKIEEQKEANLSPES